MPTGGKRIGAGRPKGSKNWSTLKRENAVIEKTQRDLAINVLERCIHMAQDIAEYHKPDRPHDQTPLERLGYKGDWKEFGAWFDRVVNAAEKLAQYQSPKLRAVMMANPNDSKNPVNVLTALLDEIDKGSRGLLIEQKALPAESVEPAEPAE